MPGVGVHYWNDARGKPGGVAGLDFGAQIPRNLFVNGGFTVQQRNLTVNSPWVCDRWWTSVTGGGGVGVSKAGGPASWAAAKLVANFTGLGSVTIRYGGIESIDTLKLTNQTLTLAISYANMVLGTASVTVTVVGGTGTDENFVNTGSYATGNFLLATMNVDMSSPHDNVVTQTVSFNTPTTISEMSVQIVVNLTVQAQPVEAVQIYGMSLAQGNAAIPYNVYSFGQELSLCQRYFQRFNIVPNAFQPIGSGQCFSAVQCAIFLPLKPNMRVAPTPTQKGLLAVTAAAGAVTPVTSLVNFGGQVSPEKSAVVVGVAGGLAAGSATYLFSNNDTTGDVFLDAEL